MSRPIALSLRTVLLLAPLLLLTGCPPSLTALSPDRGPVTGGTRVEIEGKNLDGGNLSVTVGESAAEVVAASAKKLTILTPAGAAGERPVRVETDDGASKEALPFTYEALSGKPVVLQLETGEIDPAFAALAAARPDGRLTPAQLAAKRDRYARLKAEVAPLLTQLGLAVERDFPNLPSFTLRLPEDGGDEARRQLLAHPLVRSLDDDLRGRLDLSESLPLINKPRIPPLLPAGAFPRDGNYSGQGTAVVVADSGVDYRDPVFACTAPGSGPNCRVVFAKDFTAVDDGQRDTGGRHGTHVAAIVAAVAPQTDIIAADVLRPDETILISDLLAVFDWAIANQATYAIAAINMSLGFPGSDTPDPCYGRPIARAVAEAEQAGILSVASTGNDKRIDRLKIPACAPSALRVGAVYDSGADADRETDFSNAWAYRYLVAPGFEITAAGMTKSGTSQAAPHVAGAAAVLRGFYPGRPAGELREILYETGIPLDAPKGAYRPKRLDLYAALQADPIRPRSAGPAGEGWPTATDPSVPRVRDVAALRTTVNDAIVCDEALPLCWEVKGRPDSLETPVDIRRAADYCQKFGAFFRLPTRNELLTLADYARRDPASFDRRLGPTQAGRYWTLSPASYDDPGVRANWTVDFTRGYSDTAGLDYLSKARVRCVSATVGLPPAPAPRFTVTATTAEDRTTGLTWLRAASGARSQAEAASACNAHDEAGLHWRVPTLKEALSLLDLSGGHPRIDETVFGAAGRSLTATPDWDGHPASPATWGVEEASGRPLYRLTAGQVRCVAEAGTTGSADRVHRGEVRIASAAPARSFDALQRFRGGHYTRVDGDLMVEDSDLGELVLSELTEIDGSLFVIGNRALTELSLPNLARITGDITISGNAGLERVWLPRLTEIGGSLHVEQNAALGRRQPSGTNGEGLDDAALYLRSLTRIGGALSLHRNPQLKSFTFGRLANVGQQLRVDDNLRLERFRLNSLQRLGDACGTAPSPLCGTLSVQINPALEGFVAWQLRRAPYGVYVIANRALDIPDLRALDLVAGPFRVETNPALCAKTRVDPILRRVLKSSLPQEVAINGNRSDPTCQTACPTLDRCDLYDKAARP